VRWATPRHSASRSHFWTGGGFGRRLIPLGYEQATHCGGGKWRSVPTTQGYPGPNLFQWGELLAGKIRHRQSQSLHPFTTPIQPPLAIQHTNSSTTLEGEMSHQLRSPKPYPRYSTPEITGKSGRILPKSHYFRRGKLFKTSDRPIPGDLPTCGELRMTESSSSPQRSFVLNTERSTRSRSVPPLSYVSLRLT